MLPCELRDVTDCIDCNVDDDASLGDRLRIAVVGSGQCGYFEQVLTDTGPQQH